MLRAQYCIINCCENTRGRRNDDDEAIDNDAGDDDDSGNDARWRTMNDNEDYCVAKERPWRVTLRH